MAHGYTLLELLVAIAIIALVAGAIGRLQDGRMDARRVDTEVISVRRFLVNAQSEARRLGRTIVVRETEDRHGLSAEALHLEHLEGTLKASALAFDANGLSNGGEIVITVSGQHRVIGVEPLTGRVLETGVP